MSDPKKLTSSDPKAITALVATCDVLPQAIADPITLRCKLWFAADDPRITEAAAAYERGELTVNIRAYERAQRIVADVIRDAKQNAQPTTAEQAAYIGWVRQQERNAQIASQGPSPMLRLRREIQVESGRKDLAVRLDAVRRGQQVGRQPPEDNGDGEESEGA